MHTDPHVFKVVWADFHNTDRAGNVRLNTFGTVESLIRGNVDLKEAMVVILTDGEMEAAAVVWKGSDCPWAAALQEPPRKVPAAKPKLAGLFRDDPATKEGKYLVKRRDGSVPEWPWFVLGAKDPAAPWALRAYAVAAFLSGMSWGYVKGCWRLARDYRRYRKANGLGDPDRGRHRVDDPATLAEMRKGRGA